MPRTFPTARLLIVGVALMTTACTMTLNIHTSGGGTGTVSSRTATDNGTILCSDSCEYTFSGDATVTLTATADPGSQFSGWSGACKGTSTTCTFTLTLFADATSVTAKFDHLVANPVTVSVDLTGSGGGQVNDVNDLPVCTAGGICNFQVNPGTSVTLKAAPDRASSFGGWSGPCTGTDTTCTFTASADATVGAEFDAVPTNTLTVNVTGTGSATVASNPAGIVSCSASGGTCSAAFKDGLPVTLTATLGTGTPGVFSGCDSTGTDGSGNPTCTITLSADASVTLTLSGKVTVSVNLGGAGTGSVVSSPTGISCASGGASCSALFDPGMPVALTATPDGTNTVAWTGCDSVSPNGLTCTVTPDANVSVGLNFNSTWTLSVDAEAAAPGSGVVTAAASTPALDCDTSGTDGVCSGMVADQTSVDLVATPGSSTFVVWSGCDNISVDGLTCTVVVGADTAITADFVPVFAVASSIPTNGATLVSKTAAVSVTFTYPPDLNTLQTQSASSPCSVVFGFNVTFADASNFCYPLTVSTDAGDVSGKTILFTPNAPLLGTAAYEFKISGAASSTDDAQTLGSNFTLDFTTSP